MARHKPEAALVPPTLTPVRVSEVAPARTLGERMLEARAKLADSVTIAESCYWQGALDALEAYSSGASMPEVIGAGVTKS